jgi:integrase
MVPSKEKQLDGFTLNFDSLFDARHAVDTEAMVQLSLVKDIPPGPFDLDLTRQHSLDHIDCPACQAANEALQVNSADLAGMLFSEASGLWMRLRAQSDHLRPRTHETTQGYLDALSKFFGRLRLRDITPGHIRGYQIARLHNLVRASGEDLHPWQHEAGHSIINHELSVVGQMLTQCRLWHRIKPYYFPLGMPTWSPREILSEEQEEDLWRVASKHPEASLAYWVAAITNNTSAAGIELRGLRLKNVFLRGREDSEIFIPPDSVKNTSRPRKISLNDTAIWAIGECYKRAIRLGACEPEHYLFPFRTKRNCYDPTRPPSRWFLRKSWDKLRAATGFVDLNPHDLRHHCITRLLENDQNPETVIAIAGHVNRKMLEYYAHQRRRVKYAAVMAIESKKKPVAGESAATTRIRKVG